MLNATQNETRTLATDDVVIEGTDDETPIDIPVDRRRVKTEKQDVPIETLHNWVKRGKLDLQPDFQRYFVWNNTKASRLIESLLLDIPIPVIYAAEDAKANYAVVDGQQRLTTICSFMDGTFPDKRDFQLSGLQVLTEINGKQFKDLPGPQQEMIIGTALRLIIIEHDSDPDVKFEVFERLNLGAEKLNDQELRNSMYRGTYNNLLRELASNPFMLKIMGASEPHRRMQDRQLILRFFALWRNTHLKYKGPMKTFLNREMEEHRNPSDTELARMRTTFTRCIEMAYTVFGTHAFRRFNLGKAGLPDGYWETRKLNVALWDTLLYSFAFFEKPQIIPIADRIREEFLDLMTTDATFVEYITSTTDKAERIQYRGDTWMHRLRDLVGYTAKEPRTFSLALKQQLYDRDPTCAICGQRIQAVDDAQVDHIDHYWRGGRTVPENARLTHRYCNQARGGRP